ncbi:hypothetical protein B0T22DRAFT_539236 [Podospora appendiculata]|uniref:Uncharacterized protein n=1 Tax=Podospora appendiculata TaxID=314037 RepID=A0AAE0X019_9PEZI|nr:hypothetical protein B0T22DRAFT_539236 [Podospora appendiculata]
MAFQLLLIGCISGVLLGSSSLPSICQDRSTSLSLTINKTLVITYPFHPQFFIETFGNSHFQSNSTAMERSIEILCINTIKTLVSPLEPSRSSTRSRLDYASFCGMARKDLLTKASDAITYFQSNLRKFFAPVLGDGKNWDEISASPEISCSS